MTNRKQPIYGIEKSVLIGLIEDLAINEDYFGHAWGNTTPNNLIYLVETLSDLPHVSKVCQVINECHTVKAIGNANQALEKLVRDIKANRTTV